MTTQILVPVIGNPIAVETAIQNDPTVSFDNWTQQFQTVTNNVGFEYTLATSFMAFDTQEAANDFRTRYPQLVVAASGGAQ
jgi:hypothetical protein